MKALVYGDSQTGYIGKEIEKLLKAQGFNVTRVVKSGKSTSWLSDYAAKTFPSQGWDAVYLLTGGNDPGVQASSLNSLLTYFKSPSSVTYIPLPPATRITNLSLAKKVWGSANSPNKFFPQTAAKREVKAKAYVEIAKDLGVKVIDPRDTPWKIAKPFKQPSGVVFPSQPDGIHASNGAAEVAAFAVSAPQKPEITVSTFPTIGAIAAVVIAYLLAKPRR